MATVANESILDDLNALQRDALAALSHDEGVSGPALLDAVRRVRGVPERSWYRALNALEDGEYIRVERGRSRENQYHLTEKGRGALASDHQWRTNDV